jgi:hypothetical protein
VFYINFGKFNNNNNNNSTLKNIYHEKINVCQLFNWKLNGARRLSPNLHIITFNLEPNPGYSNEELGIHA